MKNYYQILNISSSSDLNIIKKAFRKEVALYHPDNNKSPDARERFEEVIEAFNVLSDNEKREDYDKILSNQKYNKPVVLEPKQEGKYKEWKDESKKKSKTYWDSTLADLLALDILLNIDDIGLGIDSLIDGAEDVLGDIFDLF